MSEITEAVIGMPYDLAMGNEISRRQFYAIALALLVENANLKTENARLTDREIQQLAEIEVLRKWLTHIRDTSDDWRVCEKAADALGRRPEQCQEDYSVSQWIKCKDRLPEIGVDVLIRIPTCGHWNVEGGSYRGDGLWYGAFCSTHGEGKCYKVTQWAPAPREPEA